MHMWYLSVLLQMWMSVLQAMWAVQTTVGTHWAPTAATAEILQS